MNIIFFTLFLGAFFFVYYIFNKRLKLKKHETIFLTINVNTFIVRAYLTLPDIISGDYLNSGILIIVASCICIMCIRAYLKKKDILSGYFQGVLLSFPVGFAFIMLIAFFE